MKGEVFLMNKIECDKDINLQAKRYLEQLIFLETKLMLNHQKGIISLTKSIFIIPMRLEL